jgi:hypothetical protein
MLRLRGDRWIALEFKLEDLWVGAFWSRKEAEYATQRGWVVQEFHLWVCLIPCFSIHYCAASKYARDCRFCFRGTVRRYGRCDCCGNLAQLV